jgi:hypothetical protein
MKRLLVAAATGVVLFAVAGCSSPAKILHLTSTPSVNPLTGLPGSTGELLAVKVDDTPPAHPQIGIAKADVIYIEQVEGGLTRLATIFANGRSALPAQIGPVRSARISDVDILAGYGRVGFAFSGVQSKMEPVIAAANVENISAEREPASIYSRDLTRFEPTNLILDPLALIRKTVDVEKRTLDTAHGMGWTFGKLPSNLAAIGAKAITTADMRWPSSHYSVSWDKTSARWRISYEGKPDLDSTGVQLVTPIFIVQKVSITDSIYHDKVGGVTPLSTTVGSGSGFILRDGLALPVLWNRVDAQSGTTWSFSDGSVAHFTPGQVWIALTDHDPQFTYPTPSK